MAKEREQKACRRHGRAEIGEALERHGSVGCRQTDNVRGGCFWISVRGDGAPFQRADGVIRWRELAKPAERVLVPAPRLALTRQKAKHPQAQAAMSSGKCAHSAHCLRGIIGLGRAEGVHAK